MAILSTSVRFECTPVHAFRAITDFPNVPDYIEGIVKTEMLTEEPVGLNSRVREPRVMFGREASEELTVTHWQPPQTAVIEAHSHGMHYVSTYTVKPEGTGSTVTMNFESIPQTLLARIMSFVMSPATRSMHKLMTKDLMEAKAHAESGSD